MYFFFLAVNDLWKLFRLRETDDNTREMDESFFTLKCFVLTTKEVANFVFGPFRRNDYQMIIDNIPNVIVSRCCEVESGCNKTAKRHVD